MCAMVYAVAQTTAPLNLSHLGLPTQLMPDLSMFHLVTVVNLSHNNLTTLEGFGIDNMVALKKLDLSHNSLTCVRRVVCVGFRAPIEALFTVLRLRWYSPLPIVVDVFITCLQDSSRGDGGDD